VAWPGSHGPDHGGRRGSSDLKLIDLITDRAIDPGKVFELAPPLDQVAEGYRAMDERCAIKTILRP
jgi:threonine dehydrogenase-like Zn-dependent dehydrogenase